MVEGNIFCYFLLVNIFLLKVECAVVVQFDAPILMKKNFPYKIVISGKSPEERFPIENFVFSFELLKTLSPHDVLGIADVTSYSYKGDEYHGFSIKDFIFKTNSVEMNIEFRRDAYSTIFRIRYSSAKTDNEKVAFFSEDVNDNIIYERYVDLLLPYDIIMQVGPEIREVSPADREIVGHTLLPGRNGQISCQATEGLPNSLPRFINSYELSGSVPSYVNNDATKLIWMVQLKDHGKKIKCRAGNEVMNITINVYHYMTDVITSPVLNKRVKSGFEVKCISKDGFPTPRTEWLFISGPPDASKYYELQDNNVSLLINSTAPLNSNWTFECSGSNFIPISIRRYILTISPNYPVRRIYNFTIIGSLDSDVKSSSIGAIIAVIIMTFMIIIVIFTVFKNKEKLMQLINQKRTGAGLLSKPPNKASDSGYKYTGIGKGDSHVNGKDKEDNVCYTEIVGTVQPTSLSSFGPIHRV